MNRLNPHTNPIPNYIPDLVYLHRFIERTHLGDHWLIRDGKRPDRRHNRHGQAFIRLRTKPTVATGYRDSGEYCLARLLIECMLPPAPSRSSYVNACGLSQCSNPKHWELLAPSIRWRFELHAQHGWQLVRTSTGKAYQSSVIVRARAGDGVVHVFAITPARTRAPDDVPTATCGARFYAPDLLVVDAPVTCKGGC
jgi:hypothetical protein